MEQEDTIDLGAVIKLISQFKYRLAGIIVGTTLLAVAVSFILPKQYESTVLIRAKISKQGDGISLQASSALVALGANVTNPIQGYIEMMRSRAVLDPVIEQLDLPDKDKVTNTTFAKSNLRFENTKGTDLIGITGLGRTPEEAQQIAGGVTASFQQLLTRLNQSEKSLLGKFLTERIKVAKQEMEQAEQNMENFRQQEKIYVPDQQSKAVMEKVLTYDKNIAEQQVQNDTKRTKLQGINEQLQKQNVAIATYNLADNSAIQQIRNAIITKQMALVELQQQYTDKHPSIVLAKKEIQELNAKLTEEVTRSLQAGTTTLNPIHGELMAQKVAIETELLVGQAMVEALKSKQSESEQEISKLSSKGMTYVGLERQVGITREVYNVLVKNYEQTRIQEVMDSMDIQIVDEANLPKRPASPKKLLITVVGWVIGIMLSFIYLIVLYKRAVRSDNKSILYRSN